MKKPLLQRFFLCPLLFLFVQPTFADDEALSECRQIEDRLERVHCYDKVVAVEPSAPPELVKSKPVPDAQSLFGTNDAEAKRIVETTLAIEQIDQINAVVTDVRESVSKKLTVTLDNGQIWRQLDSKPMNLKSGEPVIVRKASLGSFLMEKKSGSRSIRVKRVN